MWVRDVGAAGRRLAGPQATNGAANTVPLPQTAGRAADWRGAAAVSGGADPETADLLSPLYVRAASICSQLMAIWSRVWLQLWSRVWLQPFGRATPLPGPMEC